MMNKVIAFSSFSILRKPYGDPVVAGFEALTRPLFKVAENAEGFIARAKESDDLEHLGRCQSLFLFFSSTRFIAFSP